MVKDVPENKGQNALYPIKPCVLRYNCDTIIATTHTISNKTNIDTDTLKM